ACFPSTSARCPARGSATSRSASTGRRCAASGVPSPSTRGSRACARTSSESPRRWSAGTATACRCELRPVRATSVSPRIVSGYSRRIGGAMPRWATYPEDAEPPKAVTQLAEQVTRDGGHVLACYQEPLKEAWHLFVLLPIDKVQATPYQRDLSKPHVKRLQDVMKKLGRFVDPIVAVSTRPGQYWTPNGNHRREAATKLRADYLPAILIPDSEVSFQILALNTEKAHNVKEKSLEVIRMYRGLMEAGEGKASEEDYAFQFEAPYFITLGL